MNKPREDLLNNSANKILSNFKYESIIPYEYLERITGYEREDFDFPVIINLIREKLVEYGYVLRPVINEGYKVLHPREIADYVVKKNLIGSLNKMQKGCKILHYTDTKALNKQEKERFDLIESFMINLEHENENQILAIQFQLNEATAKELGS